MRKNKKYLEIITIDKLFDCLIYIELYKSELMVNQVCRLDKESDKDIIKILKIFLNIYLDNKILFSNELYD